MMSEDVVQLHVDFVDDLLATHETSGPRPRRTPAAAPAIGASEQTWDAWASLTGHKRGSATWLSVRADAASKTPEAIARRLQNDEAAAKRLRVDGEIMRRRRAEADAVEKKDKEQFERLERAREKESKKRLERLVRQERDDMQQLDWYWSKLFGSDPEDENRWLAKRVNELHPSKRLRFLQLILCTADLTALGVGKAATGATEGRLHEAAPALD